MNVVTACKSISDSNDLRLVNGSPERERGDIPISIKNLGKCYRIFNSPRDKLNEVLRLGRRKYHREFWALKDAKALHLKHGQGAWGHVVQRLLRDLPIRAPDVLIEKAQVLDNFHALTRYPNGHPDGALFEHYGNIQSAEAIRYAGEILEFVRAQMA